MPYEAIKWLQGVLPDCEVTVKLGGTHALMYDKGEMEGVFTALQKSMTEAKVQKRYVHKVTFLRALLSSLNPPPPTHRTEKMEVGKGNQGFEHDYLREAESTRNRFLKRPTRQNQLYFVTNRVRFGPA